MTDWAIWREGREWWGCWYRNHRIEAMQGGFKTQRSARKFAESGDSL